MSRIIRKSLLTLVLLCLSSVVAYPTGAGGCGGGAAAVGGPHLGATSAITGSIEDFGAILYFGAVDKLVAGETTNFTSNSEHTLIITSDRSFRGVLFRLTSADTSFDTRGSLTVSPDLPVLEQISQVCFDEGIAGVTHLNNTDKTVTQAVIWTKQPVDSLLLEITLVVSNRIINGIFVSEYYYSSYRLTAYDPDATMAPTNFAFPTTSPTQSPAPTPQPTEAEPTPRPSLNFGATFPPTFPVTTIPTVSVAPTVSSAPQTEPPIFIPSAAATHSFGVVAALLMLAMAVI